MSRNKPHHTRWNNKPYITTWIQFCTSIRSKGFPLLSRLNHFPDAVLVTGCQRSGTTILTRIITLSEGMENYWFSPDDELDAALILSGYVEHLPQGRYCFQTTYVDKSQEYQRLGNDHKLIYLLRNPYSVVYSMLYNWQDYALTSLFKACGVPSLYGLDLLRYRLFGVRGIPKLRRACWAYLGKTSQLFELHSILSPNNMLVINYDDLVFHKRKILPRIYQFIQLEYHKCYAGRIRSASTKKAARLSPREHATIKKLCEPLYERAKLFQATIDG